MGHHRPVPDIVIVIVDGYISVVVDRAVRVPDLMLFGVDRFNYIVLSVKELVAYYLYENPLLL